LFILGLWFLSSFSLPFLECINYRGFYYPPCYGTTATCIILCVRYLEIYIRKKAKITNDEFLSSLAKLKIKLDQAGIADIQEKS